jgi:hypothetical protein
VENVAVTHLNICAVLSKLKRSVRPGLQASRHAWGLLLLRRSRVAPYTRIVFPPWH